MNFDFWDKILWANEEFENLIFKRLPGQGGLQGKGKVLGERKLHIMNLKLQFCSHHFKIFAIKYYGQMKNSKIPFLRSIMGNGAVGFRERKPLIKNLMFQYCSAPLQNYLCTN